MVTKEPVKSFISQPFNRYDFTYFIDKEIEAQTGQLGQSHSGNAGFTLRSLSGAPVFLTMPCCPDRLVRGAFGPLQLYALQQVGLAYGARFA